MLDSERMNKYATADRIATQHFWDLGYVAGLRQVEIELNNLIEEEDNEL